MEEIEVVFSSSLIMRKWDYGEGESLCNLVRQDVKLGQIKREIFFRNNQRVKVEEYIIFKRVQVEGVCF